MNRTVYQTYKEYANGECETWYLNRDTGGGCIVTKIEYNEPRGEGDAHYCDVHMSNGKMRRVFRPDNIDFGEVE